MGMRLQPQVSPHFTQRREHACRCDWQHGDVHTVGLRVHTMDTEYWRVSSTNSDSTGSGWPSKPLRPLSGCRSMF